VGVTRNGFRYVLPKQYHEEETNPADGKRAGSFGYVDPFGIRRVRISSRFGSLKKSLSK